MLADSLQSINESRISPSLLETYVRYKRDTRAIIAWLMTHGARNYKRFQTVSIRDLLVFAQKIQRRGLVMPDTIHFHFREAIAARTQLSKFFRREATAGSDDRDTVNHEYFTMCLTKIYTDLCDCCAKPMKSYDRAKVHGPSKDSQTTLPNRFAVLKLGICDGSLRPDDKGPNAQCIEYAREDTDVIAALSNTPRLVDDHLGDAFDLRKEIQEISDLRLATMTLWEQAARGETPLVVAALITNAAFGEVEQRLKFLCNDATPETLRTKFMQMKEALGAAQGYKVGMDPDPTPQIEALQQLWDVLLKFKRTHREHSHDQKFPAVRKPSAIILRKGVDSAPLDRECLGVMLQNIEQHVKVRCRPTCIVRLGTPMYADMGYFFTHNEDRTNGLRCSYGLQLLMDTYKSYLSASGRERTPSSCRLQALKFAQEAIPNVEAVLNDSSMPCRCCNTLAFQLADLNLDLQEFLRAKVFDLYFQSPWVSGSHILEMLELLFYYGLRLFSYRHYVGSIVHVYNILRECTGLEAIPLLEQLCQTFNDILFPGGRPSRNYKACCFRYMGGRLRFDQHSSEHKSGAHRLCIPARTAKATAGLPLQKEANDARFEYKKISFFHHVKERGYHLDHALWDRIYELSTLTNSNSSNMIKAQPAAKPTKQRPWPKHDGVHPEHATSTARTSQPLSPPGQDQNGDRTNPHPLQHLHAAILHTDFTGPFPPAKINFFRIYLACVRIVSLICDRTHPGKCSQGTYCLCFLDGILGAADRFRDSEYSRGRLFGGQELADICSDTIREVLGGKGLEEFLWRGI